MSEDLQLNKRIHRDCTSTILMENVSELFRDVNRSSKPNLKRFHSDPLQFKAYGMSDFVWFVYVFLSKHQSKENRFLLFDRRLEYLCEPFNKHDGFDRVSIGLQLLKNKRPTKNPVFVDFKLDIVDDTKYNWTNGESMFCKHIFFQNYVCFDPFQIGKQMLFLKKETPFCFQIWNTFQWYRSTCLFANVGLDSVTFVWRHLSDTFIHFVFRQICPHINHSCVSKTYVQNMRSCLDDKSLCDFKIVSSVTSKEFRVHKSIIKCESNVHGICVRDHNNAFFRLKVEPMWLMSKRRFVCDTTKGQTKRECIFGLQETFTIDSDENIVEFLLEFMYTGMLPETISVDDTMRVLNIGSKVTTFVLFYFRFVYFKFCHIVWQVESCWNRKLLFGTHRQFVELVKYFVHPVVHLGKRQQSHEKHNVCNHESVSFMWCAKQFERLSCSAGTWTR